MRRAVAVASALFAAVLSWCLWAAQAAEERDSAIERDVEALAPYARDHDLLNARQKQLARETGRAAIYENGTLCILEDVPEEYHEKERP